MLREHYVNSFQSVETKGKASKVPLRGRAGPVLRTMRSDFVLPREAFPMEICSLVRTPLF